MIKRILMGIIFVLMCISVAPAADRTFTWDANTEPDLESYRLYMTYTQGQYQFGSGWIAVVPSGTEQVLYDVLDDRPYYFVITAVNTSGRESGPSNEVSSTLMPPTGLQCN